MSDFRCAVASRAREESVLGTASTVRAFLLVEVPGPWGLDALRDCRLPPPVKASLRARAERAGVRALLVRRHRSRAGAGGPLRVFAGYADPAAPWLETATLGGPEVLAELDLDALASGRSPGLTPTSEPVLCVCTHGRHDACCAEQGRPVAAALHESHPDLTWEVSHLGGDRFAANVLVLPTGLYYGRVTAETAGGLAEAVLADELDLDRLRGRTGFSMPVQTAEVALRRRLGESRAAALRLVSAHTVGTDTHVAFEVAGERHALVVRRGRAEPAQLTCRAGRESLPATFTVVEPV